MSSDDRVLRGGAAPVHKTGQTVRRRVAPWSPAVHSLLRHLAEVGFAGAPTVLGIDEDGREVLSYIEGEDAHHAQRPALHSAPTLSLVGRLIRSYHDAVADFVPPTDAAWQIAGDDAPGAIICHNDLAPVNTVYVDGVPKAFIDWEFAMPAAPVWDLACAAWSFIPLYDDDYCHRYGYSTDPRGPRLRILCDAYGLTDRAGFLDVVRRRMQAQYNWVAAGATGGNDAFAAALAAGNGQRWLGAIDYLDRNRDGWEHHLD